MTHRFRFAAKAALAGLTAAVVLTGCGAHYKQEELPRLTTKSTSPDHLHPIQMQQHDSYLIPSADREKQLTTNSIGHTTYGLGTNVYSRIGSSGLHSGGFSSHLESRLSGEGIQGVKVFVVDDLVIVASDKSVSSASRYDPLQQKVLSGGVGQGNERNSRVDSVGESSLQQASATNMAQASSAIQTILGVKTKVLTVESSEAVKVISKLHRDTSDGASPKEIAKGIRTLLELAGK
ncbi:conserved hypothetical protein [Paenibacillus curdlanolyticus YK9]|uniref:Uncharacterized protein n=1 Tax=Paenibacillus curdlanolyticus YK9 TaxID=717606 RepID=E0I643_9BACL|nr:hypothetical protein [Paenibacillus curdlanolyticus]EFM12435.1 conserved hypothetical protein [Paenibacillus curdlanolyticus YK9]